MPQASAISVIIPSGGTMIGAGVMACADTATDSAKPAMAINLIILHLPEPPYRSDLIRREDGPALMFKQPACKHTEPRLECLR